MEGSRKVILCVDDEAILLLAIKRELERVFGDRYEIATAIGADAADAAIAELASRGSELALVICDWRMPGRGGGEFLSSLRVRMPDVKSILITGQEDDAVMRKARSEIGILAQVTKPWQRNILYRAVESCLS